MRKLIFFSIVILLLGAVVYVYWFFYNARAEGERGGLLQKFSRKGDVFKTFEGQMLQSGFGTRNTGSLNSQYFYFSVADEQIADSLRKCVGKEVLLHYVQFRRSLPWRGDNYNGRNDENGQYIVDRILQVKEVGEVRNAY